MHPHCRDYRPPLTTGNIARCVQWKKHTHPITKFGHHDKSDMTCHRTVFSLLALVGGIGHAMQRLRLQVDPRKSTAILWRARTRQSSEFACCSFWGCCLVQSRAACSGACARRAARAGAAVRGPAAASASLAGAPEGASTGGAASLPTVVAAGAPAV